MYRRLSGHVADWRKPYMNKDEPILMEKNFPSSDPFELFDAWFRNVASRADVSFEQVNAARVSTCM